MFDFLFGVPPRMNATLHRFEAANCKIHHLVLDHGRPHQYAHPSGFTSASSRISNDTDLDVHVAIQLRFKDGTPREELELTIESTSLVNGVGAIQLAWSSHDHFNSPRNALAITISPI